jgi:hypothetical protein
MWEKLNFNPKDIVVDAGNFLTSCKVYWLASQEGLCSME